MRSRGYGDRDVIEHGIYLVILPRRRRSFDHLVGARDQRGRHGKTQRFGISQASAWRRLAARAFSELIQRRRLSLRISVSIAKPDSTPAEDLG
jgi:hypothetical protein